MKYVYQMSTGTVNHKSFLHRFNSEEILHGLFVRYSTSIYLLLLSYWNHTKNFSAFYSMIYLHNTWWCECTLADVILLSLSTRQLRKLSTPKVMVHDYLQM